MLEFWKKELREADVSSRHITVLTEQLIEHLRDEDKVASFRKGFLPKDM